MADDRPWTIFRSTPTYERAERYFPVRLTEDGMAYYLAVFLDDLGVWGQGPRYLSAELQLPDVQDRFGVQLAVKAGRVVDALNRERAGLPQQPARPAAIQGRLDF